MRFGMAFDHMKAVVSKNERYIKLEAKLLALGGSELVFMPENPLILDHIIEHGQSFDTAKIKQIKGKPSRCHENAEARYLRRKGKERMATGYGLSPDGLWRQHSWLIDTNGTIIETTVVRTAYHGIIVAS